MLDSTFSMRLPLVCRIHHSKFMNYQTNFIKLNKLVWAKILLGKEFKANNNQAKCEYNNLRQE